MFSESALYEFCTTAAPGPSGTQQQFGNVHLPRTQALYKKSVSSLRDTDSASTWFGIKRGAGSNAGAGDGNARGGNVNAGAGDVNAGAGDGNGAAGGGNGNPGGGPPPPPDPLPSDNGGQGGRRVTWTQRRIKELEFAKRIKIKEPTKFGGKPGEDFDISWVLVQV